MGRNILGRAIALSMLAAALAAAGPAAAGRATSGVAVPPICKEKETAAAWRCDRSVALTAESFRGRAATSAILLLGMPERTRALSSGARVLVWDRSDITLEGDRSIRREECQLQMAVTRSGIVTDALLTSDTRSCTKRLGLRRQ
jgi:hypothetical protein